VLLLPLLLLLTCCYHQPLLLLLPLRLDNHQSLESTSKRICRTASISTAQIQGPLLHPAIAPKSSKESGNNV
jgi:hypothetical protein